MSLLSLFSLFYFTRHFHSSKCDSLVTSLFHFFKKSPSLVTSLFHLFKNLPSLVTFTFHSLFKNSLTLIVPGVQFFRQAKNSPVTNRPLFYAKCPILLYKQKTFKKYNETSILSQFLTLNSNLLSVFNSWLLLYQYGEYKYQSLLCMITKVVPP